jgi:hypothetical protein
MNSAFFPAGVRKKQSCASSAQAQAEGESPLAFGGLPFSRTVSGYFCVPHLWFMPQPFYNIGTVLSISQKYSVKNERFDEKQGKAVSLSDPF